MCIRDSSDAGFHDGEQEQVQQRDEQQADEKQRVIDHGESSRFRFSQREDEVRGPHGDVVAFVQRLAGDGATVDAVSYTHLDVYKRQMLRLPCGKSVMGA